MHRNQDRSCGVVEATTLDQDNIVIRLAQLFVFVALGAGVVVPTAAAEQLQANPLSVSPNDIDQSGVPVSIGFQLYTAGPVPDPPHGKPVAGVNDVEVVIRGEGQTRRFPTEELGGGRYRTEIVFPEPGGWELRVSYGAGSYGAGDEIPLGKGAIRIEGDHVGPRPSETAPGESTRWPWTMIVAAAVLAVALGAVGLILFAAIGRRGPRRYGADAEHRAAVS